MEWIFYPESKPAVSGPYVVSISKPYAGSDLTIKYVAYYNLDKDLWLKYDPFIENNTQEKITDMINGWLSNLTPLLR